MQEKRGVFVHVCSMFGKPFDIKSTLEKVCLQIFDRY